MNWRIRRVRLEAVGPADARYDDITLSFVADGRAADNAVVLLRNGGGKSLLLYLLFKALLPRRSDGTKPADQQRAAGPVVLPEECATVAIEWEHRDERRLLITGHSFERGEGEASRWMFEPIDGTLTLDTLPLRDGGRRRTRAGLMAALDSLGQRHGRLRFRSVSGVGAWERELDAVGIDPQILRYQARLNRSEGGDDGELRFATPESFVRFVLQMVLDDERLSALQQRVQTHAEQLARRDALAADAEFCREAASLLQTLAAHHSDAEARAADRRASERSLAELAGLLEAAEAASASRLATLQGRREPLEQRRRDLETRERDLRREGNVVRARTDELLERRAEADRRTADEEAANARAEREAWRVVEVLVELGMVDGELAGLRAQVEREQQGIEAAQRRRAEAASSLAGALLAAAADLQAEAEAADEELQTATAEAASLLEALEAVARRRGELQQERGALDVELSTFERATAKLRADGILFARERPSTAAQRHHAVREDLQALRQDLRERAAALNSQREAVAADIARLTDAVAQERQGAEALQAARTQAVQGVEASLVEAVQDALDVDADFSALDDPSVTEAALERARAAADARRAQAANQIEALAADERSLEHEGLLAVEPDVERICQALAEAGVEAFAALRYLARVASREERATLIASRPGLASGIVLLDATPEEALCALDDAHVLPPRRPLVLAAATAALSHVNGRATALVMPAAAAYDPDAAQSALEQLAAALTELRSRQEGESALSGALARAALTLSNEAERLRSMLPAALREERRLLTALDREAARRVAAGEELDRQLREVERRHRELEAQLTAIDEQQGRAGNELAAAELALERLGALDDVDVDAARTRLAAIDDRLRDAAGEAASLQDQRDQAIRRGQQLYEKRAALQARGQRLTADARSLPVDREAVPQSGDLPALRQNYELAEQAVAQQIGDNELRARLAGAEDRARRLRAEVAEMSEVVQLRASELAASPLGLDGVARQEARRAAEAAYERALRLAGQAQLREKEASSRRQQSQANVSAEDFARQPKVLEHLKPSSVAEGEELLARIEGFRRQREIDADANKQALESVDEQISLQRALLEEIATCRARLPAEAIEHKAALPAWTARRERVFEETTQVSEAARRAAEAHGAARERLRAQLERIADVVASADERVSPGITSALRTGETLASDADRLQGELRTRAGELDRTLAELERHRQAIIGQLAAVASDAVRKLDRVAAATTLPRQDALGAWAGKQFARISHQLITDEVSRDNELARLLDSAVSTQSRRRGLDLAFGATLALCRGRIDVSVLKPHPQPDGRYHPIEKVGPEFSGGEELTIKLVLFCAVSAVRSAERAGRPRGGRRTGPLLIDNPIGTASRESLVDLQLRLARHLDAQFIPFTGLEGELNVTGRFAAVVALTNDKDLVSGMRYVKAIDDDARKRALPPRPADTPEGAAVISAINYTPAVDVVQLADDARSAG